MKDRQHQGYGADVDVDDDIGLDPGKHSLTDQIGKSNRMISSEVGRSMRTDGIAVQRKASGSGIQRNAATALDSAANSTGSPIPSPLRTEIEAKSGADLSE